MECQYLPIPAITAPTLIFPTILQILIICDQWDKLGYHQVQQLIMALNR